jgi:hypothetical protein
VLDSLNDRIEALSRRVDALAGAAPRGGDAAEAPATPARRRGRPPKAAVGGASDGASANGAGSNGTAAPRKRGRPRGSGTKRPRGKNPAVPLHEEIAAILAERGPMSAADLATAVTERGIYAPPRSGKPLDATAVSVRVSNPRYRSRFTRSEGKIGLA